MAKTVAGNAKPSSRGIHVFDYLQDSRPAPLPPMAVLLGDEPFLRELALQKVLEISGASDSVARSRLEGGSAEWRDVLDALHSHSLFDVSAPIVIVDSADRFISACRKQLEEYLHEPAEGRLILCPTTWPATTRLYQWVQQNGLLIDCGVPQRFFGKTAKTDRRALVSWFVARAQLIHGVDIDAKTLDYLCDLAGESPGMIEQELAKLTSYVGVARRITTEHVNQIGCGWRLRTTWELIDRIVEGDAAEAIVQLQRLLRAGEEPIAVFGAIAWSLRRFAAATRHSDWSARHEGSRDLSKSLRAAGFRADYGGSAPTTAERQMKQLGWQRCQGLLHRLVQIDTRLKGSHAGPAEARRLLEGLIVELSKQART